MAAAEAVDADVSNESEEISDAVPEHIEAPDIKDYVQDTDYKIEDLESVYSELEDASYTVSEESEDVFLSKSEWDDIEELLQTQEDDDKEDLGAVDRYLGNYKNDAAWIGGGLTGLLAGSQMYGWGLAASGTAMVAGALTGIGGAAALGAGLYSAATKYFSSSSSEEPAEEDQEEESYDIEEYSDFGIKLVDEAEFKQDVQAYKEEIEEYREDVEEDEED